MNQPYVAILDLLQIPRGPGVVLISEIEMDFQEKTVILKCLYQTDNPLMKLIRTVEFTRCERLCWEKSDGSFDVASEQSLADILAIQHGTDRHGKFILIVTDLFEIRISYAEMFVKLD